VPFPARLLHDGEGVYLDTRPHWSVLFVPTLETVVVLGAEAAGFVLWSSAPVWFGWVLLAIGLVALGRFIGRFLSWRSTELVVTSMRVVYRKGALRRQSLEIPISSVQNVEYRQRIGARILGKGELQVESAGSHGAEPFVDIPKPAFAQSLINRAIDEARQHHAEEVARPPQMASIADEIERLSVLQRRGIITDDEFTRMKSELIDKDRTRN
jgi:uncharacterized membrane protein YdbT with pleckstrin-like domain